MPHNLRRFSVTFTPLNTCSVTRTVYASRDTIVKQAAAFGRALALQLGVSPMCLSVSLVEC